MVARSGVLRSDTIPKALLRVVVGDDGGNGAEFYGATHIPYTLLRVVVGDDGGTGAEFTERHIFRMLYLGWLVG